MNLPSHDDDCEMEMAMPFVTVVSRGGSHEDQAYTAGWECGGLDGRLAVLAALGGISLSATIRTENVPQADLIAMRHGYRLRHRPSSTAGGEEIPEWSFAHFQIGDES